MDKELENITSPRSLLNQCTEMVATHLDLVESFVGLPSLIGEKIFNAGCHGDRFKFDVEYSTEAVRLFTDAYEEQFLSSLSVSGEHLGLNFCLEQILLFKDLVKLDLSYCGLGDDHEMLAQFQHLNRLEKLSLRCNAVTNTGIQKMTTPYRMFNRGPDGLQKLDLRAKSYGCWTLVAEKFDMKIETEGWAKVLIDRWMLQARKKSVKSKPKPKTGAFSIRKCIQPGTSTVSTCSEKTGNQQYCDVIAKRLNDPADKVVPRSKADIKDTMNSRNLHDSEDNSIECNKETMEGLLKVYGKLDNLSDTEKSSFHMLDACDSDQICIEKTSGQVVMYTKSREDKHSEVKGSNTFKEYSPNIGNANPFKMNGQKGSDSQKIDNCKRKIHSNIGDEKVKGFNLKTLGHCQKSKESYDRHKGDNQKMKGSDEIVQGSDQMIKGSDHSMKGCYQKIKGIDQIMKRSDQKIKKSVKRTDQNNAKISKFFTSTQSAQVMQCSNIKSKSDDQSNEHKQSVPNGNQSDLTFTTSNAHKDTNLLTEVPSLLRQTKSSGVMKSNTNMVKEGGMILIQNKNSDVGKSKKRKRIIIKQNPGLKSSFSDGSDKSSFDRENVENLDSNMKDDDLNSESMQKTKKFKSSLMQSLDMCI